MAQQGYLLDTHCWLWWHIDPDKLGQQAFQLIEDGNNEIFFSVVSAWEITIKYTLNRIKLPFPPDSYIPKRLERSYMEVLPIHLEHALRVGQLPPYHNDPFDRLLIAQAYTEHLTVITKDALFKQYKIETAW